LFVVAPKVDPDDLVDATGVAEILGFASRNVVSVYRKRHPDFPGPVVDMGAGRCLLWLRVDIERWSRSRR
jgi:predicted DNA-binding transcriptional regulator AlpA